MSAQKESDREEALRLALERNRREMEQEQKDLANGGIRLRGFVWKTDEAGTNSARLYRYQDGLRKDLPLSSLTADETNTLVAVLNNSKEEEKSKANNKLLVVLLVFAFALGIVFPPAGILLFFAAFVVWYFLKSKL